MMRRAITSEFVVPESSEERRLWKERGLLEVQIEKKEKMIDNTRQRLRSGWGVQGKQTLNDEADEIQREIEELREEITLVDREIRVAERERCVEGPEEAKAIELAAKEAKEFAQASEQARQRKKEAEETIWELEWKGRSVQARKKR
jgi:hypothetical protein